MGRRVQGRSVERIAVVAILHVFEHLAERVLRLFLASQGVGHKGDLSRLIEEAVCARMLEL